MRIRLRLIVLSSILACLLPLPAHALEEDRRVEDALQLATTGNFKKARAMLEEVQAECDAGKDIPHCPGIDQLVRTAQLWDGDTAAAARTFEKIQRAAASAAAEDGCGPLAAVQLEEASMLMAQQRFKAAAELYRQVLNCDDASLNADFTRHQLGFALFAGGQWREAKEFLLRLYARSGALDAEARDGWGASIAWMLGESYLALGDVARARTVLRRAARHHFNFLATGTGEFDAAKADMLRSGAFAFRRSVETAWLLANGTSRLPRDSAPFGR